MFGTIFLFLIVVLLVLGVIFAFSPKKLTENKPSQEELLWAEEKERARREFEAEKNREWFSEKRWLADKEIDWAMERMERNGKFKVLPAHQFYLVRETKKDKLIFKELLNQIKDFKGELVFIPVNNPNFHWSLLVYEVSEKKFWHFDSLGGANWEYVESLCKGLLENIWQRKEVELEKYLIAKNDIRQENGYDCGIAVIAITKRIIKLWNQSWWDWMKYGRFSLEGEFGKVWFSRRKKRIKKGISKRERRELAEKYSIPQNL